MYKSFEGKEKEVDVNRSVLVNIVLIFYIIKGKMVVGIGFVECDRENLSKYKSVDRLVC